MKRLFCLFLILPIFTVSASITDELNSFLDFFFDNGGEESPKPQKETPVFVPQKTDIPETQSDIQKEIMATENELNRFEDQLNHTEEELWNIQSQRQSTQEILTALDQQRSIVTQKLEKIQQQKKKWEATLTDIAQEKSDLKAEIRIREQEYTDNFVTQFLRKQSLSQDQNIRMIKWFFSDKTISEILDEQTQESNKQQKQQHKLTTLERKKNYLDRQESHAATLFGYIKDLEQRTAKERKKLTDLTEAKARLLGRLEYSEGRRAKEEENFLREYNQRIIDLENLRIALEQAPPEKTVSDSPTNQTLSSPLTIPLKVTAQFKSDTYKQEFGREHLGLDLYAPQGSTVLAPRKGTVEKVALNGQGYSYLILNHGNDLFTVYGHLSDILVNEGQEIQTGETIALSGGTPGTPGAGYFTSGPHLHIEVFHNGQFRDPEPLLIQE